MRCLWAVPCRASGLSSTRHSSTLQVASCTLQAAVWRRSGLSIMHWDDRIVATDQSGLMRAVRYNRAYTINVGIARPHWSTPSQSGLDFGGNRARDWPLLSGRSIDRRQLSGFVSHTSLNCHIYAIRRIARRMPVSGCTFVVCCSLLEWSRLSTSIQAGRATRRSARTSSTTRAGRARSGRLVFAALCATCRVVLSSCHCRVPARACVPDRPPRLLHD